MSFTCSITKAAPALHVELAKPSTPGEPRGSRSRSCSPRIPILAVLRNDKSGDPRFEVPLYLAVHPALLSHIAFHCLTSLSCGLMASSFISYVQEMSFVKSFVRSIPFNLTDGRLLSATALGVGCSIWLWSTLRRKNHAPLRARTFDTANPTHRYNTSNDTSSTMVLPDGRTLGYAQYGSPTGRPVFFLHGLATTRIEAAVWDETARQLNVRLIAPDRPGTGWSSPQPGRTLLDYPKDIEQLAKHLKLEQYGLMVS